MVEEPFYCEIDGKRVQIPLNKVHTIILGSGAAGLNAAAQLFLNGVKDLIILTEGLGMGTSINTGSDKQTYYKLSLCGSEQDSPHSMAETYYANGSMHGDLALVESSLSARAFMNLVNLGVPFPRDEFGQFVGYKTDHDPRQRATSIGPYTSKEMCLKLIDQVRNLGIAIRENRYAVQLITLNEDPKRIAGLIALNDKGEFEAYLCENLIFAVGGPGGLYQTSVYPEVHTGGIGLALMIGALAQNLPESQFGLASTKFRWNVSGTYMQVIPRVISRASDGVSDEQEFLHPYFDSPEDMFSMVFLKGYQWPFDAKKAIGGSSLIDILVYIETMINGRRVYLDYRSNPKGFEITRLQEEPREYLERSNALQQTPLDRIIHMNPGAVELYKDHGIDLAKEPLEVAICAQHNNGGLAGNIWYESTNIKHLFPVGEVNGSHGVTRPGGSALNAGQVGGFRAAEFISNRYNEWTLDDDLARKALGIKIKEILGWSARCKSSRIDWQTDLEEIQSRMSQVGSHVRKLDVIDQALQKAKLQVERISNKGCHLSQTDQLFRAFQVRQLAVAQQVYLEAIKFMIESGVGSRGSSIVLDPSGSAVHEKLDETWRITKDDPVFRGKVLETVLDKSGKVNNHLVPCRPIPAIDSWFETTWARFRNGEIYD
jgi:succinate dehydrogenase/fumarate reductase flavoprotein subunit